MRRLAKEAVTGRLRDACLKSAEQFEMMAKAALEGELRRKENKKNGSGKSPIGDPALLTFG